MSEKSTAGVDLTSGGECDVSEVNLDQSVEYLCLSLRSERKLAKGNVQTLRDLITLTAADLVRRTGISRRGFAEITESLSSLGLSVGMIIDSSGNPICPDDPSRVEYPKPEPIEPSRYVMFYPNSYTFLPQLLMDDFHSVISNELYHRISRHREIINQVQQNPTGEYWRDIAYEEARIEEENALLELTNELMFLGLYRFIEIERLGILLRHFPGTPPDRSHNYANLLRAFPWLRQLFGSQAINEVRLINNCIKHSGRVSRELSRCHPSWVESEELRGLGEAYQRLAPYVGAYW